MQCDLRLKCIFHKQSGSGLESRSEIKVKVGSGSGKKKYKIILDPQHWFRHILKNYENRSSKHNLEKKIILHKMGGGLWGFDYLFWNNPDLPFLSTSK